MTNKKRRWLIKARKNVSVAPIAYAKTFFKLILLDLLFLFSLLSIVLMVLAVFVPAAILTNVLGFEFGAIIPELAGSTGWTIAGVVAGIIVGIVFIVALYGTVSKLLFKGIPAGTSAFGAGMNLILVGLFSLPFNIVFPGLSTFVHPLLVKWLLGWE